jgi:hypothetical protein
VSIRSGIPDATAIVVLWAAIELLGGAQGANGAGVRGRLHVDGRALVYADATPFPWRGITAFRLLEMEANGREADADAYLRWARSQDLTVVRVLVMAKLIFDLPPDRGLEALPRLLRRAAAHGLYVEVVALADTKRYPVDPVQHVSRIGAICAEHDNALIEIANEPDHGSQMEKLSDVRFLSSLRAKVPPVVPVALGSSIRDGGLGGDGGNGDYLTVHLTRRAWGTPRGQLSDIPKAADLSRRTGKPVVSDEPIGAGEKLEPGRREADPGRFRAMALATRLAGLGATFHYEDGIQAKIPTGRQAEAFAAWREAWSILPAGIEHRATFHSGQSKRSPVERVGAGGHLPAFVAEVGDEAWAMLVSAGPDARVVWRTGWRQQDQREWPGVRLFHAVPESRQAPAVQSFVDPSGIATLR